MIVRICGGQNEVINWTMSLGSTIGGGEREGWYDLAMDNKAARFWWQIGGKQPIIGPITASRMPSWHDLRQTSFFTCWHFDYIVLSLRFGL